MPAQPLDYGEVQQPGWFGRFLGRSAKIVRDANFVAARGNLPQGTRITATDPHGNWILYTDVQNIPRIRFRASAAWLPNDPTIMPNNTKDTAATIMDDGRIVVTEGLHRTRAMARNRTMIAAAVGGVDEVPGWLDFLHDPEAMRDTPSTLAFARMLGDPNAALVTAR